MFSTPACSISASQLPRTSRGRFLGTIPVRVDHGPSREVTLTYEVDEYGDLTAGAQYRNNEELIDFPMQYLRPHTEEQRA